MASSGPELVSEGNPDLSGVPLVGWCHQPPSRIGWQEKARMALEVKVADFGELGSSRSKARLVGDTRKGCGTSAKKIQFKPIISYLYRLL